MKARKDEVEEFLKEHEGGRFTQKEIAEGLDLADATVSRWVSVLEAEGKIEKEEIGSASQVSWVEE